MAEKEISKAVIARLPRYYRYLGELMEDGVERISSNDLSVRMKVTASQIRQDLNNFGGFGQQGYGYIVEQLYTEIGHILGVDNPAGAVLIGAGNLGCAIANHIRFENRGIRLVGIFDDSPAIVGTRVQELEVQPTTALEAFCQAEKPAMAILCIPREAAPDLVRRLTAQGIHSFWNFSHYDIAYDYPDAIVENVHLGDSLLTLAYQMKAE